MWSLGLLNAGAAEFGPQQVRSGPGQPLRAVIVLGNVSQAEADGLSVKLAPRDAFRQAGLRYDPTLDKLSVSVTPTGGRDAGYSGTYLVHVDSAEPVSTSFLDLLLVLEWRTGRQSNAVTLSAIPEASATQPQAVVPAAAVASSGVAPSNSAASSAAVPAPAQSGSASAGVAAVSGDVSRKVGRGDSLSSIAREYTGGEGGTTLAQMMTALFEANRSAFIGNDPNRLRQGATLTRPADAQVQSIPPAQARKFVSAAREQFDAYRARLAESTAQQAAPAGGRSAQGAIEAGKAPEAAAPATRDELKLSRPGKGGAGGTAGRSGGSEEEQIAQGKAQTEAQGRVNELQKNVADLQKLLAMKNQAVANLEQQAATASGATAQEKTAKPADSKATTAPAAAATNKPATADAKSAEGAASGVGAAASGAAAGDAASAASAMSSDADASAATAAVASDVAAASAAAAASAPTADARPTSNPAMNWRALAQHPYVLPGAGALVVLLGLWWLMRRRRAEPPVGQPGPYDDGRDGRDGTDGPGGSDGRGDPDAPHGAAPAAEPAPSGVAAAGVVAAGAAGAAALYAANQAEADEHLHPEAEASWSAPADDVADAEAIAPDPIAVAGVDADAPNVPNVPNELDAWDAAQDAVTDELAATAQSAGAEASQPALQAVEPALGTPAEPLMTAAAPTPDVSAEPAGEAEIDWEAAFAEEAGKTPVAHDDPADATMSSLEALGAAAAIGGVAAATQAVPEGGVAGMLGDLDLGIPGQPANVGTISSDALPSLSKGIGSVQFTMAPPGDPRLDAMRGAASGDMSDQADPPDPADDLDGELSDADFDAAMQQSASAVEAPRSYSDAAHEAPSLRPLSFDLSDFSLDLKGDDAAAAVTVPTLPAVVGEEALIEHETLAAPAPQTPYAQAPAAPQEPQVAAPVAAAVPEVASPVQNGETVETGKTVETVETVEAVEPIKSIAPVEPVSSIVPRAAEPGVPDEFHTKLELATAYQTIGDDDGARELLEEVIAGGDATQQSVARARLAELGK
ncbi:FimV/HubP family polar landmark protein [Pandoraea anhela]|uniref:Peptidoglycan-binding LysM n=1 Tax=Pandoraea anhela TaxID=2508295 RepID=A0A5E4TRK8_9BURK|nr:FimV/HubP family polar landmark protein [Pandoraea anhela]VVD90495.1 peptidoglycan-binding LysM [Pandoraea anhela]